MQMLDGVNRTALRAATMAAGLSVCLAGCILVPVTTEVYDRDCQVNAHHMTLQAVQVGAIARCRGDECAALLVFVGATAAASAVVSGSIVVVGNVAYWFEKQGRCVRSP